MLDTSNVIMLEEGADREKILATLKKMKIEFKEVSAYDAAIMEEVRNQMQSTISDEEYSNIKYGSSRFTNVMDKVVEKMEDEDDLWFTLEESVRKYIDTEIDRIPF